MWDELGIAIALVLVIEGIMPFISPSAWRQAMMQAGQLSDSVLRMIGFASMITGVIFLYLLR